MNIRKLIMPRKNRTVKHKIFSSDKFICDKNRYRSKNEAQKAAEFQMLENMSIELSIYKCGSCGYWHLTRNTANS